MPKTATAATTAVPMAIERRRFTKVRASAAERAGLNHVLTDAFLVACAFLVCCAFLCGTSESSAGTTVIDKR